MTRGTFKLVKSSKKGTLYADVSVTLERSTGENKIKIGSNAFDWLKKAYGENAVLPRDDDEYVVGALKGAKYALSQCPADEKYEVVIETIRFSPVDSTEDSVAFATCRAVWDALQIEPKASPEIIDGNVHW